MINVGTVLPGSHPCNNNDDDVDRRINNNRRYALFLYALTTLLLFGDQNLLAPNLTAGGCTQLYTFVNFCYPFLFFLTFFSFLYLFVMIRIAADEFGFDDEEKDRKLGGDIALAFFLLGAPASFVIGCMADTTSQRNMLFGVTVLIGEGACALTYFTTTYEGLFVTRALTGFSVGGALPLLSSLLGDWCE